MYRRLDQSFRAAYCRLWKGMILTDAELVQSAAREMGLGEFAEVRRRVPRRGVLGARGLPAHPHLWPPCSIPARFFRCCSSIGLWPGLGPQMWGSACPRSSGSG